MADHDRRGELEAAVPEMVEDDDGADLIPNDVVEDDHPASLMQCLLAHGVSHLDAANAAARMTHSPDPKATSFFENYGRGAISQAAAEGRRNLNVVGLRVLDLRTMRDDNTHWDLSKPSHRRDAFVPSVKENPDWVICAPPCTAFSLLN